MCIRQLYKKLYSVVYTYYIVNVIERKKGMERSGIWTRAWRCIKTGNVPRWPPVCHVSWFSNEV